MSTPSMHSTSPMLSLYTYYISRDNDVVIVAVLRGANAPAHQAMAGLVAGSTSSGTGGVL